MNEKLREMLGKIRDARIREGMEVAIGKNLLPAHTGKAYPGHYCIVADGGHFGAENTWPGLDSWQMAGAYILMGGIDAAKSLFDFVMASQRANGDIPFAIFPAEEFADPLCDVRQGRGYLKGLRYPEDVFTYQSGGRPARSWIGLFKHWVVEDPLNILAPVSYILTAAEIYAADRSLEWLKASLPSVERAARAMLALWRRDDGLIHCAGFYAEMPTRNDRDGVAQCYAYKALTELAALHRVAGNADLAAYWTLEAETLKKLFHAAFWKDGRHAQYIHPVHGTVFSHGLCDTDLAAIAFGLTDDAQAEELWAKVRAAKGLWWGAMPTQTAEGHCYAEWELSSDPGFEPAQGPLYDAAAMGRVWYLDTLASLRMKDHDRLREGARLVSERGLRDGGHWYERYQKVQNRTATALGPRGYCEYAAILVRTVLGNLDLFS